MGRPYGGEGMRTRMEVKLLSYPEETRQRGKMLSAKVMTCITGIGRTYRRGRRRPSEEDEKGRSRMGAGGRRKG